MISQNLLIIYSYMATYSSTIRRTIACRPSLIEHSINTLIRYITPRSDVHIVSILLLSCCISTSSWVILALFEISIWSVSAAIVGILPPNTVNITVKAKAKLVNFFLNIRFISCYPPFVVKNLLS